MPSYGELAQIITAAAALGAFLLSWRNSRKIEQVRHATNSLTDRLVESTDKEAHARGLKEGQEHDSSKAAL